MLFYIAFLLSFFWRKRNEAKKSATFANCSAAKRSSPACFGSACNSICLRRGNGASFCLFSQHGYFCLFFRTVSSHCSLASYYPSILKILLQTFFSAGTFACFSALFLRTVSVSLSPHCYLSCFRQLFPPIIILKYYIYGSIVK